MDKEAQISKRETLLQELEALVSKCNLCLLLLDGFLSFCVKRKCVNFVRVKYSCITRKVLDSNAIWYHLFCTHWSHDTFSVPKICTALLTCSNMYRCYHYF
jgi:hypothetical protein